MSVCCFCCLKQPQQQMALTLMYIVWSSISPRVKECTQKDSHMKKKKLNAHGKIHACTKKAICVQYVQNLQIARCVCNTFETPCGADWHSFGQSRLPVAKKIIGQSLCTQIYFFMCEWNECVNVLFAFLHFETDLAAFNRMTRHWWEHMKGGSRLAGTQGREREREGGRTKETRHIRTGKVINITGSTDTQIHRRNRKTQSPDKQQRSISDDYTTV